MFLSILNLTQHAPTTEQSDEGVFDLPSNARQELVKLLNFDSLPTAEEVKERAQEIARLVVREAGWVSYAMIGGAPFLMGPLEKALLDRQITPVYAFSSRESVEEVQADGSVRKVAVFRHKGFIHVE